MSDDSSTQDLHRARRRRQARISPIWIVPAVAVLIGLWLVIDNLSSRGPLIVLEMANAEGIEAGRTSIRALNVEVGLVERVELSEDLSHTLITARMSPNTERMLVEDTQFWVEKPRIGREGISGLTTVLSGVFIQLQPGQSQESQRRFSVLNQPPVSAAGAMGLYVRLVGQPAAALSVGDPVTFQGLTVGRVEEANFDTATREMHHRLFIEAPYDVLITENTRFWTASGIGLQLDAQGFRVWVESLETLLVGGVAFGYLEGVPVGDRATEDSVFTLFPDEESARQDSFNRYIEYALLIDGNVNGLAPGAPVAYRGVRVGTVAQVPWNFNIPQAEGAASFAIPVLIRIEPDRMAGEASGPQASLGEWEARFEELFHRGLRASLKTGNLLTGSLYVDLDFTAAEGDMLMARHYNDRRVFPSTSGGFAQLEAQVAALLDKLNGLPIEPVLNRLEQNLAASEAMLGEVRGVAESLRGLMDSPEARALPASLDRTMAELRATLQGFAPESAPYEDLTRAMQSLEILLRDLRPMARTLSDQPSALIFGSDAAEDPVPRAAQ